MIDGFWLSTRILLALTVGVIYFRYASRGTDSNWPVVYYAFTLIHANLYPEALVAAFVYTGVIAAALLRFEFMSGWFLKVVHSIEYICLIFIAYRLTDLII